MSTDRPSDLLAALGAAIDAARANRGAATPSEVKNTTEGLGGWPERKWPTRSPAAYQVLVFSLEDQPPLIHGPVDPEADYSHVPRPFRIAAVALEDNFDNASCEACERNPVGWSVYGDADEHSRWNPTYLVLGVSGRVAAVCQECAPYDPPPDKPEPTETEVQGEPQLLTVEECAQLVGVTPSTWRAYVARQQAPEPTARYARTPLWERSVVAAWHAGRRSQQSTQPQEAAGDGNVANVK